MSLEKIICVQDIGSLVNLKASNFGNSPPKVLLFFGENGTGKSTMVEILRSLASGNSEIIHGRKALSKGDAAEPKVQLIIDSSHFEFDGKRWSEQYPNIKIFDSVFIENNIYSGSVVERYHYENQSEIIVGEKGVKLINEVEENKIKLTQLDKDVRNKNGEIANIIRQFGLSMEVEEFIKISDTENIDHRIKEKEEEKKLAENLDEVKNHGKVSLLGEPIIEVENFISLLSDSLEDVFLDCHSKVRNHIDSHIDIGSHTDELKESEVSPEAWLRAGHQFKKDDNCPFCAQDTKDIDLIKAYASYFSNDYNIFHKKITLGKEELMQYISDDFKKEIESLIENNNITFAGNKDFAAIDIPDLPDSEIKNAFSEINDVAVFFDEKFTEKLKNLNEKIIDASMHDNNRKLENAIQVIESYNKDLKDYNHEVDEHIKESEQKDLEKIKEELRELELKKHRLDPDIVKKVNFYTDASQRQQALKKSTDDKKEELREYARETFTSISQKMNEILVDLGADFKIGHENPNFKGNKPTVESYFLIAGKKVEGRSSDKLNKPSFSNTLSAGDRSTLALAFFLADIKKEGSEEKIIIMDDPFTSLDHVRRYATAKKIREIAEISKQVIVFSHDMQFLDIVLDKLDRNMGGHKENVRCVRFPEVSSVSNTGAELKIFDLKAEIEQEEKKAVRRIRNFVKGGEEDANNVAKSLRVVLENFYRNQNPEIFSGKGLGDIIYCMKDNNSYTEHLMDKLNDIKDYTNKFHHGASGGVEMHGSKIELRKFCEDAIRIIEGNY